MFSVFLHAIMSNLPRAHAEEIHEVSTEVIPNTDSYLLCLEGDARVTSIPNNRNYFSTQSAYHYMKSAVILNFMNQATLPFCGND
jgi:hypothetical protein